jgi:protein-glutamine gamma-glutamyltransferase
MVRIETVVNIITYCIALISFLTVIQHISITISVIFTVVVFLSIYQFFYKSIQVPNIFHTIISIIIIVFFATRIERDDIVMPSIEALTLLLAVKLLSTRVFRDYMQIYAMSLLLLAGSTLIDISAIFLIYFMFTVLLLNAAVVSLAYYSEDPTLQFDYSSAAAVLYKTSYIAIIAIPMTSIFFFILPRSTYPLLTFLNIGRSAHSGFTDRVRLGDVIGIQANSDVVFRAQMDRVKEEDLYWRGVVLDYFDGKAWRSTEPATVASTVKQTGPAVTQSIYLEPTDNKYLFALDRPIHIRHEYMIRTSNQSYRAKTHITGKTHYTAQSLPSPIYPAQLQHSDSYLQLPAGISRPVVDLVGGLIAGQDPGHQITVLSQYFRQAGFRYSLENLPLSEHPIDDFLLSHKYGHCEYFASALALMLRIAGIPSRVVGGYRGGTYNDMGRYYVVSQNEAHLWVEAYVVGTGWLRLDPTPPHTVVPKYYQVREFFRKMGLMLDTINYYWNMVVINYSFRDQFRIATNLAQRARDLQLRIDRSQLMILSLFPLLLGLSVLLIKTRWPRKNIAAMKLINEFNEIMKRRGYYRAPNEGLEELLDRITDEELRGQAKVFVVSFEALFYRDRPLHKPEIKSLQSLLRKLQIGTRR